MISIFNGRSRSLGDGERKDVYLQVHVAFRRHLHHFRGAKLAVFEAIALHSDEQGWSWPTVATLRRETGYQDDAIYSALNGLEKVAIKGRRVLLRTKTPPPHYKAPDDGNYARNFYLIFPSPEDLVRYAEDATGKGKKERGSNKENHLGKSGYGFSGPENPDTVFPGTKKNNGSQAEPSGKEKPHTQPEPGAQPALFAGERDGNRGEEGVCVSKSRHSKETRKEYQLDPENVDKEKKALGQGWFIDGASGRYDDAIDDWKERRRRRAAADANKCDATCPLCFGTSMQVVPGKGARRCPNSAADAEAATA